MEILIQLLNCLMSRVDIIVVLHFIQLFVFNKLFISGDYGVVMLTSGRDMTTFCIYNRNR